MEEWRRRGWDVVLTARAHGQTAELAQEWWPDVETIGGASPAGRTRKGSALLRRAAVLGSFARRESFDAAVSHGSYAQLVAARAARVPSVTIMDYEFQPANHLAFRLADRVVVPAVFPARSLRRFGAPETKVVRYAGFKEELYLAGFRPDPGVLDQLGVDPRSVLVVLRPPPDGALYHRTPNGRFDDLVGAARGNCDVTPVLLPRTPEQSDRYAALGGVVVPRRAIDARSLMACADVTIGAGGTMSRESALLGTPTYTVFNGRLAAVDRELIRLGLLHDLRNGAAVPQLRKRSSAAVAVTAARGTEIAATITDTVEAVA